MPNLRIVVAGFFFVFVAVLGFKVLIPKDLKLSNFRTLASLPNTPAYDLSGLSEGSLRLAATKRVLSESIMSESLEEIHLELAHFQLNIDGRSGRSACDYFGEVQVTFEAQGIAVSGEKPKMQLELPCLVGANDGYLRVVTLPKNEIVELELEEPTDSKLFDDELVMRFQDVIDFWPKYWQLKQIVWIPQDSTAEPLEMNLGYDPASSVPRFEFQLYQ